MTRQLATDLIPLWLRAMPLFVCLAAGPLCYVATRWTVQLGLREHRQLSTGAESLHWTERARTTWGTRSAVTLLLLLLPMSAVFGAVLNHGEFSLTSVWLGSCLSLLTSFAGAFLATRHFRREIGLPKLSFPTQLRSGIFTIYLLLSHLYLCVAIERFVAGLLSRDLTALAIGILALAMPLWSTPLLRAFGVERANSVLEGSLQALASRVNVRLRSISILDIGSTNAYAYPWSRRIALSQPLVDALSREELEAVVAHELGHLEEGWRALTRCLFQVYLALSLIFARLYAGPLGLLAMPLWILGYWPVLRFQMGISRKLELRADAVATEICGTEVYARALLRIHEANLTPVVLLNQTHPSLAERVMSPQLAQFANQTKPDRGPFRFCVLVIVVSGLLFQGWPLLLRSFSSVPELEHFVDAVTLRNDLAYASLGKFANIRHDGPSAIALFQEAERLEPNDPAHSLALSNTWFSLGSCVEGNAALSRAKKKADAAAIALELPNRGPLCHNQ